jgi:hypothetical protein
MASYDKLSLMQSTSLGLPPDINLALLGGRGGPRPFSTGNGAAED